ncbi:MAG: CoA-binding protein [Chloroflexi bacterium]|nr:CoA-binding protein [Chloroflexota bacterium]
MAPGEHPLEFIFQPRSIAVAGASPERGRSGNEYVRQLQHYGFRGPIYPVHPEATTVEGLPVYRSVLDAPGPVDYVISCVPAAALPQLVDECGRKGVRALHAFTGRFRETGRPEAAALEQEVRRRARRAGLRLIGPNCMGLYVPRQGIGFKYNFPHEPGPVAFLSQSGGNCAELVYRGSLRGLRFSKVISYGNGLDLTESDFLDYLAADPETAVVGAYMEGVQDGRRLLAALQHLAASKPVVVLKGGRTRAGARSVSSHTGSLAGATAVWDVACRQAGAIQVSDLEEMIDLLVAFRFLKPVQGLGVGVVGGGGGRTVQSADDCEAAGLTVVPLPPDVREKLRPLAPAFADWIGNPLDISILAGANVLPEMVKLMGGHPAFDAIIANVGEDWFLDTPESAGRMLTSTLKSYLALGPTQPKPFALVLGTSEGPDEWRWRAIEEAKRQFWEAGLAVFPTIARAARALAQAHTYYRRRAAAP